MSRKCFQAMPGVLISILMSVSSSAMQYDETVLMRIATLIRSYGSKEVLKEVIQENTSDFVVVVDNTLQKSRYVLNGIDEQFINVYSIYYDMNRYKVSIDDLENRVVEAAAKAKQLKDLEREQERIRQNALVLEKHNQWKLLQDELVRKWREEIKEREAREEREAIYRRSAEMPTRAPSSSGGIDRVGLCRNNCRELHYYGTIEPDLQRCYRECQEMYGQ